MPAIATLESFRHARPAVSRLDLSRPEPSPPTATWADDPVPPKRLTVMHDTDLPGGDIKSYFDTTYEACAAACLASDSARR